MSVDGSPPVPTRRRIPRKALLRFSLLVIILVLGFGVARWSPLAGYFDQDRLIALFGQIREQWWAPILILVLYLVVSPLGLPVSPLLFCSGALYGVWFGTLLNTVGLFLGAASSFVLAKWLGRDFVVHLAGERLQRAEALFEKRGFWPLVQIRFLPVPFSIVNYGAALAGVKAPLFLVTTAIGLGPMTLLHTFFAAKFAALAVQHATGPEWLRLLTIYGIAWGVFAAVTVGPSAFAAWRRRRRYRRLVAERQRLSAERRRV